jgi:ribosomal protein S18 acetylase RimI-like enzyme
MIIYRDADEAMRERIGREWGEVAARHMHFSDGFSIVALDGDELAGLIAIVWRELPPPLVAKEAYIDIIEVAAAYRRREIATRLVELAAERARAAGACQLRAWSSSDKTAAIALWRALGFGLHPATTYPGGHAVDGFFVTQAV